jgi:hypothetical protein
VCAHSECTKFTVGERGSRICTWDECFSCVCVCGGVVGCDVLVRLQLSSMFNKCLHHSLASSFLLVSCPGQFKRLVKLLLNRFALTLDWRVILIMTKNDIQIFFMGVF